MISVQAKRFLVQSRHGSCCEGNFTEKIIFNETKDMGNLKKERHVTQVQSNKKLYSSETSINYSETIIDIISLKEKKSHVLISLVFAKYVSYLGKRYLWSLLSPIS